MRNLFRILLICGVVGLCGPVLAEECFWTNGSSSWIKQVEICLETDEPGEMFVYLLNGRDYVYFDVEFWLYEEFVESRSPEEFFNRNIRDYYDFDRLR